MTKELPNDIPVQKTWDKTSVTACVEAAKREISKTWEKIEHHDLGTEVLSDEEFRDYARELSSFVYKFARKAKLADYSGLFLAVRLSITQK